MNLESQVCSLELAKRLKELEVKQESLFYWADGSVVISINMDLLLTNEKVRSLFAVNNDYPDEDIYNLYSAFTCAELGEILPWTIDLNEGADFKIFQFIEWKITNKY